MTLQRARVELIIGVGSLEHTPVVELVHHPRNVFQRRGGVTGGGERRGQLVEAMVAVGQYPQQRKDRTARVGEIDSLERPAGKHQRAAVAVYWHGLQPGKDGHRVLFFESEVGN